MEGRHTGRRTGCGFPSVCAVRCTTPCGEKAMGLRHMDYKGTKERCKQAKSARDEGGVGLGKEGCRYGAEAAAHPRSHPRLALAQQRIQLGAASIACWAVFCVRCVERLQGALTDAQRRSCRQAPEGGPQRQGRGAKQHVQHRRRAELHQEAAQETWRKGLTVAKHSQQSLRG